MDYLERLQANREGGVEYAATASVKGRRRKRRLTKSSRQAKLSRSAATTSPGKGKGPSKKTKTSEGSMAKKKAKRRKARTAKQQAATRKMIRAAKAKRRGTKSPRRRSRVAKSNPTPKRRRAKRRKKRSSGASEWFGHPLGHSKAAKKGWRKRKKRRKSASAPKRRRSSGRRRTTEKQRRAARRNIKKAHAARRGRRASAGHRSRSSRREAYAAEPRRKGRRKGRRRSRRRGALENPMTGVELFVGGITGLLGFLSADAIDRVLASHALTDKGTKDANGIELYADNPPTSGNYAGLFNATAICAPMDAKRWIVGILVAGIPVTIAHFISAPTGRAALQFFGVAAGFRIVGKGLIDLVAMVTKTNPVGQRLFDGEMRAAALKSGGSTNPELASLPSAGLGRAPALTAGNGTTAPCGCGKCAKCNPNPGAGYPSMPREVSQTVTTPSNQLQPPAATPPSPPPGPPPGRTNNLFPPAAMAAGPPRAGRFGQWGAPDGGP
jgi:hypothetical protein